MPGVPDRVEDAFVYFVTERAKIWYRRNVEKLPPPWTEDPILRQYRFTNVCRKFDRMTEYLIRNWYQPHYNELHTLRTAVVIARCINLIEFLDQIGYPQFRSINGRNWFIDPRWMTRFKLTFLNRQQRGQPVKSGAYFVYSNRKPMLLFMEQDAIPGSYRVRIADTFEATWRQYCGIPGIATFMAGQFCKDLTYACDLAAGWPDRHSFAVPGPGSILGVRFLFNEPVTLSTDPRSLKQFCNAVLRARDILAKSGFMDQFPELAAEMDLMDIQNCLCEFAKYWQVLNLDGRTHRKKMRVYRYGNDHSTCR